MCEFEKKVWNGLIECGVVPKSPSMPQKACLSVEQKSTKTPPPANLRVGVAVSGGADSISLLLALSEFFSPLYVITVNHNIRPAAESRGDVDFVLEVCEELRRAGREIICDVVELERGAVDKEADRRGGGIEEAARNLRYAAFGKFIASRELSALCLAHNRNDQLETVLMRFLQGSPAEAAAGIRARRGCFVRPLLGIERREIEEYVASRGFSWRTDKTNYETDYLRNKIRLKLVPFLNENFTGWQTAVLSGAEKALDDAELIQSCMNQFSLKSNKDGSVEIPLSDFLNSPDSLKYRILLEASNRAGETSRIPHQFLKDVISAFDNKTSDNIRDFSFTKHFAGIDIICEKNQLFVKKHAENNTDFVFSAIIEKTGTFSFPFGKLDVLNYKEQAGKALVSVCAEGCASVDGVSLPFCVRNVSSGDTVKSADGSEKKVSDIFSDWHVASEKRSYIPVIQLLDEKSQRIIAVLGGCFGYKDWIVKL